MEINNKDIWQFGDQYIDANTGKSATKEEIAIFNKKFGTTEERKKFSELAEKKRQEEDKKWHLKYDSLMQKFFEWDDEDIVDYAKGMKDEHLCYQLATALFDASGGHVRRGWRKRGKKRLEEIKQTFPEHWEKAVELYKSGCHDT